MNVTLRKDTAGSHLAARPVLSCGRSTEARTRETGSACPNCSPSTIGRLRARPHRHSWWWPATPSGPTTPCRLSHRGARIPGRCTSR